MVDVTLVLAKLTERQTMRSLILGLLIMCSGLPAMADDYAAIPDLPGKLAAHGDWLTLAANENAADISSATEEPASAQPTPTDGGLFTRNKVHKYLGLGSLGLVGLSLLAPKPDSENGGSGSSGLHHGLAVGATVLGAAAVATGFAYHYKDINLSKGFRDPDNMHMILATLAELGFIAAVSMAPDSSHAAMGALGAAAMATAIKIEW